VTGPSSCRAVSRLLREATRQRHAGQPHRRVRPGYARNPPQGRLIPPARQSHGRPCPWRTSVGAGQRGVATDPGSDRVPSASTRPSTASSSRIWPLTSENDALRPLSAVSRSYPLQTRRERLMQLPRRNRPPETRIRRPLDRGHQRSLHAGCRHLNQDIPGLPATASGTPTRPRRSEPRHRAEMTVTGQPPTCPGRPARSGPAPRPAMLGAGGWSTTSAPGPGAPGDACRRGGPQVLSAHVGHQPPGLLLHGRRLTDHVQPGSTVITDGWQAPWWVE
jgi:hypothetical protein